jgi:SAM-dependent methyltransferase
VKTTDTRIENEIRHGASIADNPGKVWNWESPAGKKRWQRRTAMLSGHISPEMYVLELGCGTGYYTKELLQTGARICAIDISPDLLAIARRNIHTERVSFVQENAYSMGFKDNTFDTVVGSSVLHHLDIDKAMHEVFRVLKPGGQIAFTEPNMLNPQIMIQKNIPYIKQKLGDSLDETAFFKWQLHRILKKNGFRGIRIEPFDFLHPAIPEMFVPAFEGLNRVLEKTPFIKEIAGSLFIRASK